MQIEQLGPYRLGKKLGQGGMGAVYAGVDTETGEPAAVKVLAPSLAMDEGFRVRFEAEIESLKKLKHPNIVRLYGYGEQAGTLFYAMELIDGTSLEEEIRAGRRFDWREVTQIGIKLSKALKHAHDHGVIHRDLKPANVMVTSTGELRLADFGIARLFGNTRLTSDGGVLGTAEYMAPEQADGRMVTDRCDQYSLGGMLYALLAGRPPFRAKTLVEMLQLQRFAEPEPVTRFAPHTPAELVRIIHQLLEKEPQKRFANTLILARSLEAMERGLSISQSGADDFVLSDPGSTGAGIPLGASGYDPTSATLSPEELAAMSRGDSSSAASSSESWQATEATLAYQDLKKAPRTAPPPLVQRESTGGVFTKVGESTQRRSNWAEVLGNLVSPQTLGVAVALLALMGTGWYLMRKPTADELYERIEVATADGEVASIKNARSDIADFLDRFPDDPRGQRLRDLQDEARQAHPVQRAYNEAMRYSLADPEMALARFSALIDVYDDGADTPDAAKQYVKLAHVQQKLLEKRVASYVEQGRQLLDARLSKAAELTAHDPQRARQIYQGIVELYGDKPWAEAAVAQARSALSSTMTEKNAAAK